MKELLLLIVAVGIVVLMNIALGMWNKIGKQKIAFNWKILVAGIIKGVVFAGSFVAMAYAFQLIHYVPDVVPEFILLSVFTYYTGKVVVQWKEIAGISTK